MRLPATGVSRRLRDTRWRDVILPLITALQSVANAKWKPIPLKRQSASGDSSVDRKVRDNANYCARMTAVIM